MLLLCVMLSQHIGHLGNWPTKTHSSWDASGSIFIQAPSPVDGGQLHVIFDVSWGWFLFLPASPAYRQWAMQPFHLQRKRTIFVCLFFLEEHVDLYRQTVFLRFLARSFPVSSFEITGSKLYRSFRVPCLPWALMSHLWKRKIGLGHIARSLSRTFFGRVLANGIIGPTSNVRSFCELIVVVFKTLLLRLKAWMHTWNGPSLPSHLASAHKACSQGELADLQLASSLHNIAFRPAQQKYVVQMDRPGEECGWLARLDSFQVMYCICAYIYIYIYNAFILMTFTWLMKYLGFVPMTVKFAFFLGEVVFHECWFYS